LFYFDTLIWKIRSPALDIRTNSKSFTLIFLTSLLLISGIAAVAVFWPFLKPGAFAAVLAIGLYPLHNWFLRKVRSATLAATLSTFAVLFILVIPTAFTIAAVSGEMASAGRALSEKSKEEGGVRKFAANLIRGPVEWTTNHIGLSQAKVEDWYESLPAKASGYILGAATVLVSGLAGFAGQTVITFFILFFLFRDGPAIAKHVASLMPLTEHQVVRLFTSIQDTIVANLYGILAVALVQGILTGGALEVLGVPSALMLGVLAGLCSLIPLVGTALIWVPASLYLFMTASVWKGIFLLLWGSLVVGSSDNIIRPLVVRGRVEIHPLLVMFSILGALDLFGFIGIFLGPMILSLLVALGELTRDEWRKERIEAAISGRPA
jgi:predicted PurR-regulated permease PerM